MRCGWSPSIDGLDVFDAARVQCYSNWLDEGSDAFQTAGEQMANAGTTFAHKTDAINAQIDRAFADKSLRPKQRDLRIKYLESRLDLEFAKWDISMAAFKEAVDANAALY
jgi:hypothetical protein